MAESEIAKLILTCTWPAKISVGAIAFFSAVVTGAGTLGSGGNGSLTPAFGGKVEIKTAR